MGPSLRLQHVIDHVDVRPSDHVVEVGCGHGVAATLVLERLTTGTYTGVDRSVSMIAAAEQRNRDAVHAGSARFVLGSFGVVPLGVDGVDRLFAARVAAMTGPVELTAARRLLRRGGVLVLSIDAPSEPGAAAMVVDAERALGRAGFEDVRRITAHIDGGRLVSVTGVRA